MDPDSDRNPNLGTLLGDVFSSEEVEPELMVRYADAPDALSAEERQAVEAYLSQAPAHADELAVLRRFDLSEIDERAAHASEAARSAAQAPGATGGLIRRIQRLLGRDLPEATGRRIPVWAVATAASVLLILWLRPLVFPGGDPAPPTSPPMASRPGTGTPVAQLPSEQRPRPVSPAAPSPPPQSPLPEASLEQASRPPARADSDATKRHEPEPVERPIPEPPPRTPPEQAPVRPIANPPLMIAMATPIYHAPPGSSATRVPRSGIRGTDSGPGLIAVAPLHVGRTSVEQPALYWYLTELPEGEATLEFTMADADSPEPLVQATLVSPTRAGLQRIDLTALGVRLPLSVEYRWAVALRLDPDRPSRDPLALGWIERGATPEPVAARLEAAGPAEIPFIYAEAGFWYDAVATLSDLIERHPENASLMRARAELFKQGGLELVATPPQTP